MFKALLLLALFPAGQNLPDGHNEAHWGMSVEQLQHVVTVQKASGEPGSGYAEHGESDPEVYIDSSAGPERVEYYFFQGKLYKIFIVYDRSQFSPRFYNELTKELRDRHGKPDDTYDDHYFGYRILHTTWRDDNTLLDLRIGGGFVFKVLSHRPALAEKARLKELKQSI